MKTKKYLAILLLGISFICWKNSDDPSESKEMQYIENNKNSVNNNSIKSVTEILKPLWSIEAKHGYGAPLVENGIVFLPMGLEYAVDAKNGNKLFFDDEETKKYFKSNFKDSIVLFNSQNRIALINLYSGDLIYDLKRTRSWPFFNTPEIIKSKDICILKNDKQLICFDMKASSVLWTYESEFMIYDKIIVIEKEIYVTDSKNFYCFSNKGDIKWQVETGPIVGNPVVVDNFLYVYVEEQGLYAINLDLRKIEWFYNHKYKARYIGQKIVVVKNTLLFIGPYLYALNRFDGNLIWESTDIRTNISNILSLVNDYLILYDNQESIPLINILNTDGKLEYRLFTSDFYPPESRFEAYSYIDDYQFMFADNIENDLLIGLPKTVDSLYCFQIKTPACADLQSVQQTNEREITIIINVK
jgi:outer membrane protein assembly factor BamB